MKGLIVFLVLAGTAYGQCRSGNCSLKPKPVNRSSAVYKPSLVMGQPVPMGFAPIQGIDRSYANGARDRVNARILAKHQTQLRLKAMRAQKNAKPADVQVAEAEPEKKGKLNGSRSMRYYFRNDRGRVYEASAWADNGDFWRITLVGSGYHVNIRKDEVQKAWYDSVNI